MTSARKQLLVVYHSQSGNTAALAEAVVAGATLEEDIDVHCLPALEAETEDLLRCDAVIFGSPENLGYLSGGMKNFFDRTYYPAQPHELNIPYAIFISAGNDGSNAVRQIQRIARGYPLRQVADEVIVRGEVGESGLQQCRDLGQALAAGLSMGIF